MRRATPPVVMKEPPKIKNGMASSVYCSEVSNSFSVSEASESCANIKIVTIEGAVPSKESVLAKKYPYARPTFYYTNGEPTGEAAKFVAFTLGDEGQGIASKIGFVPVR